MHIKFFNRRPYIFVGRYHISQINQIKIDHDIANYRVIKGSDGFFYLYMHLKSDLKAYLKNLLNEAKMRFKRGDCHYAVRWIYSQLPDILKPYASAGYGQIVTHGYVGGHTLLKLELPNVTYYLDAVIPYYIESESGFYINKIPKYYKVFNWVNIE